MTADSSEQIFITGHLDLPVDELETLKPALQSHVDLSRQEDGCISFEFEYDAEIEGRIHLKENYASAAAFDAHRARAVSSGWAETSKNIVRHLNITTGKPA